MTDLRTAAQTVVDDYCIYKYVTPKSMNMLEQALANTPSMDALLAEIDRLTNILEVTDENHGRTTVLAHKALKDLDALIADLSNLPRHIDHPEIDAIIEKYRSNK